MSSDALQAPRWRPSAFLTWRWTSMDEDDGETMKSEDTWEQFLLKKTNKMCLFATGFMISLWLIRYLQCSKWKACDKVPVRQEKVPVR